MDSAKVTHSEDHGIKSNYQKFLINYAGRKILIVQVPYCKSEYESLCKAMKLPVKKKNKPLNQAGGNEVHMPALRQTV